MFNNQRGYSEDAINYLRGLCMGAADIIPGVSGGTVALILGHYERLVGAIARVDRQFLDMLLKGQVAQALKHIDARFLVALALGILTGIVGLAQLMHYLLEHHQPYVFAALCGMILASSYLVTKRIKGWAWLQLLGLIFGVYFAWQICVLNPLQGELNLLTAFISAVIAICAMILPGISGAFVLLLLGMYFPITGLVKELPKGILDLRSYLTLVSFGLGCIVGLLSFSRVLRWLLANYHDLTMAWLIGLMIGSLYRIWPFQLATPETASLPFSKRETNMVWPSEHTANATLVFALLFVGLLGTILIEYLGSRLSQSHHQHSDALGVPDQQS